MRASAATNDALFDQVCELLQVRHRKRAHHTPLDTLNRLFVKVLIGQSRFGVDRPWLTSRNTLVTTETRSKQEFATLAYPAVTADDSEDPIVVIRHRGVERILHGNGRCRSWAEKEDSSPCTALVLVVREP
jgi:hypothetical protein